VRGEHLVEAVWARDWSTLWHALKRLMIPLYLQNQKISIGIFTAVLFLLFLPFPILVYSAVFESLSESFLLLFSISAITVILLYCAAILEAKKGLSLNIGYALLCPIGGFIIVIGFAGGILQAKSNRAVMWRGRTYSMVNKIQNSISV